jgi:hypothetical protein
MRSSLVVLIVLLAAGCERDDPLPAPVHGRVFYQGSPLSHGSIVFTPDPDRGGSGPLARGNIQADGTYTLTTDGRKGAPAGWHRVSIVAVETSSTRPRSTEFAEVRSLLPRKYAAPDLSGLEALVKAGEDNVIEFRLE